MDLLEFVKEIGNGLVIIDFWAPWCAPCKMVAPELDRIAEKNPTVKIMKINVDESSGLVSRFEIKSIPTLIIVNEDQEIFRFTGFTSEKELQKIINKNI